MSLLSSQFSLLDIRDVESFTGRIVERSGLQLSVDDREQVHVYLSEECWLLSTRFQPSRISFSSYAGTNLRLRIVDWQRQRFGRTAGSSRTVSTNGHGSNSSASTPTAATVNWTDLSEEGRWRLQKIALPISCGLSAAEVAHQLGTNTKWAKRQLDLWAANSNG